MIWYWISSRCHTHFGYWLYHHASPVSTIYWRNGIYYCPCRLILCPAHIAVCTSMSVLPYPLCFMTFMSTPSVGLVLHFTRNYTLFNYELILFVSDVFQMKESRHLFAFRCKLYSSNRYYNVMESVRECNLSNCIHNKELEMDRLHNETIINITYPRWIDWMTDIIKKKRHDGMDFSSM